MISAVPANAVHKACVYLSKEIAFPQQRCCTQRFGFNSKIKEIHTFIYLYKYHLGEKEIKVLLSLILFNLTFYDIFYKVRLTLRCTQIESIVSFFTGDATAHRVSHLIYFFSHNYLTLRFPCRARK